MRYRSLTSVNFILIDGRIDSELLQRLINQSLIALNERLQYHIVVLCNSQKAATAIDFLGEQCGHELFFHGEKIDSPEEFQVLLNASKLFVVPAQSWNTALATCKEYKSAVPLLLATTDNTRFYADGACSDRFVETTPLNCFFFQLGKNV